MKFHVPPGPCIYFLHIITICNAYRCLTDCDSKFEFFLLPQRHIKSIILGSICEFSFQCNFANPAPFSLKPSGIDALWSVLRGGAIGFTRRGGVAEIYVRTYLNTMHFALGGATMIHHVVLCSIRTSIVNHAFPASLQVI